MSAEPTTPTTLIVIRESLIGSIISDTYMFSILVALPWFNHRYCGGSGWINAAIAFAWFIVIIARAAGRTKAARKTPAEARQWLDEKYPA